MSSQLDILVAEDEVVTRRLIEKFLAADGHRVHAVENGATQRVLKLAENYDLVWFSKMRSASMFAQ